MFKKIQRLVEIMIRVLLLVVLLKFLVWSLTVRPTGIGKRVQIKEEGSGMAKVFTYVQQLLAVTAIGVAQQRVVVSVDGTDQEPQLLPVDATEVTFKVGPEGANVKVSLDYLDTAGNDSANFEDTFIVADEIPPEAPLGFGTRAQTAEEEV